MPDLSKGERILQALVALWDDPGKPAGLTVHRNPARPIPSDELSALAVGRQPDATTETVQRITHSPGVERALQVLAEIRTGDADVESLIAQTDEIYVWVISQVALDRSLDGLCENIVETGSSFEAHEADLTYHAQGVLFTVYYTTSEDDPTSDPEDDA